MKYSYNTPYYITNADQFADFHISFDSSLKAYRQVFKNSFKKPGYVTKYLKRR